MNDIVKIIKVEPEEENSKQNDVCRTLFCFDFIAENIERNKHNGNDSAINIGKDVFAAASDRRLKRGKMICKEIKNVIVELIIAWKCARCCRAGFETEICRKKRNGCKSDSHERAESEQQTRFDKSAVKDVVYFSVVNLTVLINVDRLGGKNLLDRIIREEINEEIEHGENANHVCHVVVREECDCKSNNIEGCLLLIDYSLNSENNKREQVHCVDPHNIPVIGDKEAAECIENTESGDCEIVFMVRFFKIIGHCRRGKGILDVYHCTDCFGDILMAEK